MIPKKINIITLGCSKNLVDSEYLLKQLEINGFDVHHDAQGFDFDIVLINTCGFIDDAKEESINTILNYVKAKNHKKIKKLYVFGCLAERYKDELTINIPEVDMYFGVYQEEKILNQLNIINVKLPFSERKLTQSGHFAYLKISEGCNRKCAFCAIPLIKGKYKSRPVSEIIKEAEILAKNGVKEIILIAQDLTYYGYDLENKSLLTDLVKQLSEIDNIKWIRLHYAYPAKFPKDIILLMKITPKICRYIDIPIQHISDPILKSMKRGINKKQTIELLYYIRSEIPDITIRTTVLVGFPGETKEDFDELKKFIKQFKFDRLGVFKYSDEENTAAFEMNDKITESVKNSRFNQIMKIQNKISLNLNLEKIGKVFQVIIDRKEGEFYIGRTEHDSPEVDNEVLIKDENLIIGDYYMILITDASDYDLTGKIINNKII
ncbi:MAG: 30S ribosomal protein S12 methylthiotransferase RimO [Bacteroidota bacterium]